jgi:predicted unusual protein kinase regulating ubiquinone biosynthesis (AarF/ABC1/UbiB family)
MDTSFTHLDDDRLPSAFQQQTADSLLDISKVVLHEVIGAGSFSQVYRGTYMGHDVAVKRIILNSEMKYVTTELAILRLIFNCDYLLT